MSWKRVIIAGVAFVIAVFLYVLDRKLAETAVYASVNEASLTPGINKSEVTEVRLRNRYGEIVLVREQERWRMVSPYEGPTDAELVDQLLTNVTGARKRNEVKVSSLEEFGLAVPEITLALRTSSGKSLELQFGHESTYTGQIFATQPGSKRVFTVSDGVVNTLRRTPLEFRRTRLLEVDAGALDSYLAVRITKPDAEVELRNERGQWQIVKPQTLPAENTIVQDFLQRLGMLRADGFVTEASDRPTSMVAALQALESPILVVTLEKVGVKPLILTIGQTGDATKPVYVAQRQNEKEIMVIRRETLDEMDVPASYFRSRSLFTLKPEDVGYVAFEIGRARTDLVRNAQGLWEFVGDPHRRVDQSAVNTRLEVLLKTRIRDFVDMEPRDASLYGLVPPRYRFTVVTRDKQRTESLEIGKSEPQNVSSVYARRGGDPAVFTVDMPRELVVLPETLADPHLVGIDLSEVLHMEIEIDGAKYDLRREGMEWKLLKPGQTLYAPVDLRRVTRLLETTSKLRFDKDFTASGEKVIAPVEKPQLVMKFFGADDKLLAEISFGKRLPSTSLAKDEKDRTYEVKNSDLDFLIAQVRSVIE
ncbi:MAG: DUF4340 domain-containing protein [Candidatus Hydrogenedentota bacterium]|jgi:hypothetical protein|nr:DUF4340 domain-containing protein [Candidatus Sumerlaea chitinivorans]RMH29343.1 MAG: DUF4340 domain-containing protein [Candidatus Hydrogenedentota bacterium]GIX45442.1 MAG: hypothetical protein KatS3mg130_1850 [Candidatus Sumerlaea sp.]